MSDLKRLNNTMNNKGSVSQAQGTEEGHRKTGRLSSDGMKAAPLSAGLLAACRLLVRLAGCFVGRFERLRFRRFLLTQKDAEHDIDGDRQIFRLPGLQR